MRRRTENQLSGRQRRIIAIENAKSEAEMALYISRLLIVHKELADRTDGTEKAKKP